jgi:hypothetical protein
MKRRYHLEDLDVDGEIILHDWKSVLSAGHYNSKGILYATSIGGDVGGGGGGVFLKIKKFFQHGLQPPNKNTFLLLILSRV